MTGQKILVMRDAQELGPYSKADIRLEVARGNLKTDDQGWSEGMESWQPLYQFVEGLPQPKMNAALMPDWSAEKSRTPISPLKLTLSIAGGVLAAVIVIWGVCWGVHISKEKRIVRLLDAKLEELNSHDIKSESVEELKRDADDIDLCTEARSRAIRSGADPFWFIKNVDDDN